MTRVNVAKNVLLLKMLRCCNSSLVGLMLSLLLIVPSTADRASFDNAEEK